MKISKNGKDSTFKKPHVIQNSIELETEIEGPVDEVEELLDDIVSEDSETVIVEEPSVIEDVVIEEPSVIEDSAPCCCKYEEAICHIKDAIASLCCCCDCDEIAKESIANLSVVVLDLSSCQ